ncbi:MAG: hypothetical protein F4X96_04290 [Gammaproteobacteria bacterium]|nr:hypothetical protein [Chromatiales bacterium]MYE48637.1 hypothetical protein [Gammaproteobacteria bacterium]
MGRQGRTCFIGIAAAVLISACGGSGSDGSPPPPQPPPPDPASIELSTNSIDAEAGGGDASVDVSNGGGGTLNWTASIAGGVDWARISSGASGTDSGTIRIAIDANAGAAREFELTVSAAGASSRTVTVRQAEGAPNLNVSPARIDAEAGGGNASVDVTNRGGGTLDWNASIAGNVDWARISSGASGTDAGSIAIEIDANTGAAREFELTVSAGDAGSRTVTVQQAEAPAMLEVTAAATELDGYGGSISLQVSNTGYAPMRWSASLPDGADWAYIESGEEGTNAGEIVVRYGLNGGADRELDVTVTALAANNSPQSLTLGQEWFASSACTYPEARQEVLDLMQDWYYWNDEPEQRARYGEIVIEDYDDLDSLLDDLRWRPETHDRNFSYWSSAAATDMLFDGRAFIFGFRGRVIVDVNENPLYYQVIDVYAGAPAGNAGLERGDRIVGLNGKPLDSLTVGGIFEEFGPNEEGFEVSFEIEKQSGERRTFGMAKEEVEVPTVPEEHVRIFDTDAGKVGYLHFRTFFGDANGRLLHEFAEFNDAGVKNLIVDLRYNGGGSVPIAYGLTTLIGGPELFEGRLTVMSRRVHNLFASSEDETAYFDCGVYPTRALAEQCRSQSAIPNVENVVFITGRGSASASELVITSLQPYENVSLVGERTYGKPVGQYGLPFCPPDRRARLGDLWPVTFATVNAEGFEDYYDGLPVTEGCQVQDDLTRQLGDPQEGRLAAALRYLETGSCGATASSRPAPQDAAIQQAPPKDPVNQFLGH